MHPVILEMFVTARQEELVRSARDARRGRTAPHRHLMRRRHTQAH